MSPHSELVELKDALRDALERRGTLGTLRAQIRRDVFNAMEDSGDAEHPTPKENLIINELIREYLAFNNYRHALAVFTPEASLPAEPLRRSFVASQTQLSESGGALPLLYSLLADNGATPELAQPEATPMATFPESILPAPVPEATADTMASRRARVGGPTPVIFTARP